MRIPTTRMLGALVYGGTSALQSSESNDSFTHNFRGGDCECNKTNALSQQTLALSSQTIY